MNLNTNEITTGDPEKCITSFVENIVIVIRQMALSEGLMSPKKSQTLF